MHIPTHIPPQIPTRTQKNPIRWALLCIAACVGAAFSTDLRETRRAEAQVVDPGRQRNDLLKETKRTNELLTEIRDLLKQSGTKPDEGGR